ncbi:MAG: sugar ABC transporter permease [Actinomycetota bacterium]|nr:sugar ABC transporter permease [Actinomycetota bacterium]
MTATLLEPVEVATRRGAEPGRRRRQRSPLVSVLMVAPAVLFLALFVFLPAAMALGIGFFHYHLLGVGTTFAGLTNFKDALSYPIFWRAAENTALFALLMVPTTLVGSVAIALVLNGTSRGFGLLRSIVLLPYVTPVVATAIGWIWIFNPQYGVANYVLHGLGLPGSQWLLSPTMALPSVAIYTLWHGLGFDVVLVLAGLASLPRDVMEAASIDGAGRWQRFYKVQMPLLSPTLFFVAFVSTLGALQSFSQIYALSSGQGGPGFATTTLLLLIYQTAFSYFHFSYGAAMALLLVVMILVVVGFQRWLARRWAFYQ